MLAKNYGDFWKRFQPTKMAKKILYLVTRADAVGGASIHTRDMAAHMKSEGWEVLIGVGGSGPVTAAYERAGVPYVSLRHFRRQINPWSDLLAFFELIKLIADFKPDLISAHTSKAGFIGRFAARCKGVPVIYTPHCWSFVDGFPKARIYLFAERVGAPLATAIVTVSENERQEAIRKNVGHPDKIITIHNGMPDIAPEWHAQPAQHPPRLVMVGRFEEQKDHETLLTAMAQLKDLPWTLDLVGEGPHLTAMQDLAATLQLSDRINFLGYRSDIAQILAASQVFLLITNWEGFPRSILEAMRAGLPVVATDVGGNGESVIDGENGCLVRHKDAAMLSQKLRPLLAQSELRLRMGRRSRDLYEKQFTFRAMADRTMALYRQVLPR